MSDPKIADRLFDGARAESELEDALTSAGALFELLGWDEYDTSLEVRGVPAEYRLSIDAQRVIHGAGFLVAFLNHADEWETHYRFDPAREFVEVKGWRVSYPFKRKDQSDTSIWIEEIVPTWPKDWMETGYCRVVSRSREKR